MSIANRMITYNNVSEGFKNLPIHFHAACDKYAQENVKRPEGISYFYQLMFVVDGKGILKHGGKNYELKRGCAFFTGINIPTEYINTGGLVTAFLTAYGPAVEDLMNCFSCDGFLFYESTPVENFVSAIKQIINQYYTRKQEATLSAMTYSVFVDFFEHQAGKFTKFDETILFIEKNFTKKITLSQLAEIRCASVTKLCQEFKNRFDCTIFQYILNLRLNYAHNLLMFNSEMMVKDAAISSGFNDISYFGRAYKEKFGKNPSEIKLKADTV